MIGFKVATPNDFETAVQRGQTKSERWRGGASMFLRAADSSVGQHFARTYNLEDDSAIPNDSTSQRIAHATQFLLEDEKLEGYLSEWLLRGREEYMLVVWAQAEIRQQASGELRQAMARFLNEGKL
jgi:hypothetical protein